MAGGVARRARDAVRDAAGAADAVHKTDRLAELVCSNSFRGDKLDNAVGLLKEEMRRLGSLVMRAAEGARVPAGAALAVDRERFARPSPRRSPRIRSSRSSAREIDRVPEPDGHPWIIATGPLTSDALSAEIARFVGGEHLYFYDAISPIVLAETIDRTKVFRQSRVGQEPSRGGTGSTVWQARQARTGAPGRQVGRCGMDDGQGDYLNCPFTRDEYERFYDALVAAESATVHDFDKEKFFEGCLPIEVMAHRGRDTLRFGPMKPVGLTDPRTGRQAYAVVQLRQDNLAGDHFSLVGFQTQLKWGEQARVLRLIPGLEQAEFVRFGMVHRNTYINGPTVLRDTWQTRARRGSVLRRAGERRRGLRRVGGVGPARRAGMRPRWRAAARRRRRRGRPPSARWRITCRTPSRSTTSRPTSPSASWRRSSRRGGAARRARTASGRSPTARWRISTLAGV